jgi:predicted enzyme related to lactoylglutathione lyase
MNSPGYFEIQADDPERAIGFYTAVFRQRSNELKILCPD